MSKKYKDSNGNMRTKWYRDARQKPKEVYAQNATRTQMYRIELQKIVKALLEIECPDEWDVDYMKELLLLRTGYIIISKTPGYGILPIKGSLTEPNYISNPTKAVMAAPIIGNWENTIGVDCELIYLQRSRVNMYYTYTHLVDTFAQRLANVDGGIDVNILNSRTAYMIEAETRAQAETVKNIYDDISNGEPLVVYRHNDISGTKGMNVFFGNVKNNYIANEMQDTKRSIMNEFLTLLGINNANTDKKERLITAEADSNNIELEANIDAFVEILERQVKKVKKVFPELNPFNITFRYKEAMEQAERSEDAFTNNNDRPVGNVGNQES